MKIPVKRKIGKIISAIIFVIIAAIYLFEQKDSILGNNTDLSGKSCSVHFFDVSQGDSSLIICDGVTVLIDAGENNKGDDVLVYLKELKISSLDYIIGTHAHSDHIGGLDTVINSIDVENIILYDLPDSMVPTTKTYTDLLNAIVENNVNVIPAKAGESIDIGNGKLDILSPLSSSYDDHNDFSIVTRFVYGDTSFLFMGDAEEKVEKELIKKYNLKSTLLKVGHHGSNTSSSIGFLNEVIPEIAVIQVGANNSYSHPHKETLTKLNNIDAKVYRTDLCGNITATTDGENITIYYKNEE